MEAEVIIATIEALQAKRSAQRILEVGSKKLLISYLKLLILNQVKIKMQNSKLLILTKQNLTNSKV